MGTNTCSNCRGEGLVGSGDQPWLRIGHLSTCKQCNGTGSSTGASDKEAVETAHAEDGEQAAAPADNGIEKAVEESTDGTPVEGAGAVDETHATIDTTQTVAPRG